MKTLTSLQKALTVIRPLSEQPATPSEKTGKRKPKLLVVMGLIGTGKSTLCHALTKKFPLYYAAADNVRVALFPKPVHSKAESKQVYKTLYQAINILLCEGKNVLMEATLPRRINRDEIRERFRDQANMQFIFLDPPRATHVRRLKQRKQSFSDPMNIAFQGNEELLKIFESHFEPPNIKDEKDVMRLRNTNTTFAINKISPWITENLGM